jgi:hypothetical protein
MKITSSVVKFIDKVKRGGWMKKTVFLILLFLMAGVVSVVSAEQDDQENYGVLQISAAAGLAQEANVSGATNYMTEQLQKVIDASQVIYGSRYVPEEYYKHPTVYSRLATRNGFDVGVFYKLNRKISIGIKGGGYEATNFTARSSAIIKDLFNPYISQTQTYEYHMASNIFPFMIGTDYSDSVWRDFYYGGKVCAGFAFHKGSLVFKNIIDTQSGSSSTLTYDRPFSSTSFIAETSGKFGYNICKYFGIFIEMGYFYAPLSTEITDVLSATANSISIGAKDHKENVKMDFSSFIGRIGILINI